MKKKLFCLLALVTYGCTDGMLIEEQQQALVNFFTNTAPRQLREQQIGSVALQTAQEGGNNTDIANAVRTEVQNTAPAPTPAPGAPAPAPAPGLDAMAAAQTAEELNARIEQGLEGLRNGTLTIENAIANNTFAGIKDLTQIQTLAEIVSTFVAGTKSKHAGKLVSIRWLFRGLMPATGHNVANRVQALANEGVAADNETRNAIKAAVKDVLPGLERNPFLVETLNNEATIDGKADSATNIHEGEKNPRLSYSRIMVALGSAVPEYFREHVVRPLEVEISHYLFMGLVHGADAVKYISLDRFYQTWVALCKMRGTNNLNFAQAAQDVFGNAVAAQNGNGSGLCLDGDNTKATAALDLGTIFGGVNAVISHYYTEGDFNDAANSDKFGLHTEGNIALMQANNFLHAPRVVLESIEYGQVNGRDIAGVVQLGAFWTTANAIYTAHNTAGDNANFAAIKPLIIAEIDNCKCPPELSVMKSLFKHITAGAGFTAWNDDQGNNINAPGNMGECGRYVFDWLCDMQHEASGSQKIIALAAKSVFADAAGAQDVVEAVNTWLGLRVHTNVADDPKVKVMLNKFKMAANTGSKSTMWNTLAEGADWYTKLIWDYCTIVGTSVSAAANLGIAKKETFAAGVFPVGIAQDMRVLTSALRYIFSDGANSRTALIAATNVGAQAASPTSNHIKLFGTVTGLIKQ